MAQIKIDSLTAPQIFYYVDGLYNGKSENLIEVSLTLKGNYNALSEKSKSNHLQRVLYFYLKNFFTRSSNNSELTFAYVCRSLEDNNNYDYIQRPTYSCVTYPSIGPAENSIVPGIFCTVYYVETLEQLEVIHKESENYFRNLFDINQCKDPLPPIIVLVQNEDHPLLQPPVIASCEIPILAVLQMPLIDFSYKIKNSYTWEKRCDRCIGGISGTKVFKALDSLFSGLAIKQGLTSPKILQNQIEFFACVKSLDVPEVIIDCIEEHLIKIY